jgi:glycosyltransferase involved in cell wall biosynthesis
MERFIWGWIYCRDQEMKILFITNEVNTTTGWGVTGYNTIKEISKKHACDVITLKKSENLYIENVNYFPILTTTSDAKVKMLLLLKDYIQIRSNVSSSSYDVVHFLIEPFLPLAFFFNNKYLLLEIHGTYGVTSFVSGFNRFFYKKALLKIDTVISNSQYTKDKFIKSSGYIKNIEVVPLGVDVNNKEYSYVNKEKSFCFVGHIKKRKGLINLLRALNEIIQIGKYSDTKLYLIGSDKSDTHAHQGYLKECMDYIDTHNMGKNIIFTGKVSEKELYEYYKKCKANVLPSININNNFEGFGLIHLEANSVGTLTIGSNDCGNETAINNKKSGYLLEQNNVDELKDTLIKILKISDENYKKISTDCIRHAKNNTWGKHAEKLNNIYKNLR